MKSERTTLADFLLDRWLPTRRPPVLEESTWHSYDRYIRLHVVPHVGRVPLQKLSPVDLNQLYTHVTPPMQRDAAERVAGLIRGASNSGSQ